VYIYPQNKTDYLVGYDDSVYQYSILKWKIQENRVGSKIKLQITIDTADVENYFQSLAAILFI